MEPKAKTRIQEILAEWDSDNQCGLYESAETTIDLSNIQNTVSITSPYTVTTGSSFPNAIWTSTGTGTASPWATFNPNSASTRISLSGDEADIEVNGWSLVSAVKSIEERLGLLQPNPELEREWKELKRLGDRYRKLEQRIRDKQSTFDRLRAMPAPDLD